MARGVKSKSKSLWKVIVTELRKRGLSFIIEPFASYMTNVRNVDPASCLESSPCLFYTIAKEYFNNDLEAARFFINYLFSIVSPDKFSMRLEILKSMEECDDEKAKRLIRALLNEITT